MKSFLYRFLFICCDLRVTQELSTQLEFNCISWQYNKTVFTLENYIFNYNSQFLLKNWRDRIIMYIKIFHFWNFHIYCFLIASRIYKISKIYIQISIKNCCMLLQNLSFKNNSILLLFSSYFSIRIWQMIEIYIYNNSVYSDLLN